MLGEDSLGHVHVLLGCVALKSYHCQSESRTIPYQHSVRMGYTPTMVIANPDISWLKEREFSKYRAVQGNHLGFCCFYFVGFVCKSYLLTVTKLMLSIKQRLVMMVRRLMMNRMMAFDISASSTGLFIRYSVSNSRRGLWQLPFIIQLGGGSRSDEESDIGLKQEKAVKLNTL